MKLKRLVLLLCLIGTFVILGSERQEVKACSGPEPTFQELYEFYGILAKGTVVETDDLRQSAIVHVETYYKGGGTEYLLLARLHVNEIQDLLHNIHDCQWWEDGLFVGDTIYFFASRITDGSYVNPHWGETTVYKYNLPDDIQDVSLELGKFTPHTEVEFLKLITKTADSKPIQPIKDNQRPLKSPLLISTEKAKYVLPVDWQPPVPLRLDSQPNVYAPVGAHFEGYHQLGSEFFISIDGERCMSNNCITMDTYMRYSAYTPEYTKSDYYAALLFPPDGLVAIWTTTTLEVHTFITNWAFHGYASLHNDSKGTTQKLAQFAQWSSTGKLAYSDLKGLWVWDVYNAEDKPKLVKPTSPDGIVPTPRYFSPRGRYLAITEGDTLSTVDLQTEKILPDGLVSPDDRLFIAFEKSDKQTGLFKVSICQLNTGVCKDDLDFDFDKVKQIDWTGNKTVIALLIPWVGKDEVPPFKFDDSTGYLLRDMVADFGSFPSVEYPSVSYHVYDQPNTEPARGFAFAFDRANNTLAVIKDKSTLIINKREYDIGRYLDGDIVSIRWLPSLLYREPR